MGTDSATRTPAKVVLCGYGTEGDSRPLVTFASWLTAHGYDVTLLLEADGVALAHGRGLRAHPLAGDGAVGLLRRQELVADRLGLG